jgi:uncharacterized membrane protein
MTGIGGPYSGVSGAVVGYPIRARAMLSLLFLLFVMFVVLGAIARASARQRLRAGSLAQTAAF